MLISRFEEIKMLEDETFEEFYSKMSDLRNSMVSLGKTVLKGISSRERRRHTMRLSVMSPKKKKLLNKRNF
jgi:hypothetical protein